MTVPRKQPFNALLNRDMTALAAADQKGLLELVATTRVAMTIDGFTKSASADSNNLSSDSFLCFPERHLNSTKEASRNLKSNQPFCYRYVALSRFQILKSSQSAETIR
jgi:hypothetical protein